MKTLADIAVHPGDRTAIEASVRLLRERFPVERVILFGSKARGTDDAESDIDLLILTREELSWRERDAITDLLFDVECAHDVVISTLVVSSKRWSSGPYPVLPIYREIERYGVAA
jgi:predicted nucleotidyltransferase